MIAIPDLLHDLRDFVDTLHVVEDPFGLMPDKKHRAACIDFQDVHPAMERFVEELIDSVVPWVYSHPARESLLARLRPKNVSCKSDADRRAWARLARTAKRTFRTGDLRGQFSELVLANMLQHYFRAAPLLRKMPITTSPSVERYGADAVHLARVDGSYRLYLGEAKTYSTSKGGFRDALKHAIDDAINLHRPDVWRELSAISFQEGVPSELEDIGNAWLEGNLREVEIHVVCIATYERALPRNGASRAACLDEVITGVIDEVDRIQTDKLISNVPPALVPRLNYILFPICEMDRVIDAFGRELGTA